jgi:hypothetical protein
MFPAVTNHEHEAYMTRYNQIDNIQRSTLYEKALERRLRTIEGDKPSIVVPLPWKDEYHEQISTSCHQPVICQNASIVKC